MKLSILIKTLNEEALIANCLEATLKETLKISSEIILVDSFSTDRTIEIARRYSIRIIQFVNKSDCDCASAVQLGYQYAHGEYLYVLDGDMQLQNNFLTTALNYLESNPDVAGVSGRILDTRIMTAADKLRVSRNESQREVRKVSSLGGGGLYRRKAIESVGYLAHRWLPACEEAELGARLRTSGWHLIRLPEIAVLHTGHIENNIQMLRRLRQNRRIYAYGMYLRTAFRRPWWWLSVRDAWFIFAAPVVHATAAVLATGMMQLGKVDIVSALIVAEFFVCFGAISLMTIRKRSISDAFFAFYSWHYYTLFSILGFMRSISSPEIPIKGRELTKK